MPSNSPSLTEFVRLEEKVDQLRGELQGVQSLLTATRNQLADLREAVRGLEDRAESGEGSFTLLAELRDSEAPHLSVPRPSQAGGLGQEFPTAVDQSAEGRRAAARQVGLFLRRALDGLPRGESGRSRIQQASKYWIVVKDFNSAIYDPVRVFSKWGLAKDLVKRGSECGDSVFVGLPALEDVRTALEAGRFSWQGLVEA